jgi:DNA-binding SARP family transcriptional activator
MFRLQCFGYPRIEAADGASLDAIQGHPKRFAVLIYLACHDDRPVRRDSLIPLFWPEVDEWGARRSLRLTLDVLRRLVGDDTLTALEGGNLIVDPHRLGTDVRAFQLARSEERLGDALAIHHGPFLAGFSLPDSPEFSAWVERTRRALKDETLDVALRLAQRADANGDTYQAIGWWYRALELSPYDEYVLTSLVWALTRSGDRVGAHDAYLSFQRQLMGDLALEPSLTTRMAVGRALRVPGSAWAPLPPAQPRPRRVSQAH